MTIIGTEIGPEDAKNIKSSHLGIVKCLVKRDIVVAGVDRVIIIATPIEVAVETPIVQKTTTDIDQVTEADQVIGIVIGIVIEIVIESEVAKMRVVPYREQKLSMEREDVLLCDMKRFKRERVYQMLLDPQMCLHYHL